MMGSSSSSSFQKAVWTAAVATILVLATSTTNAFQPPKSNGVSKSQLEYVEDPQKIDIRTIKAPQKDYTIINHDHERSFWLQALQNLDDSSTLWTKIGCAFAPKDIREELDPFSQKIPAHLVRVGDSDLDIAIAVPKKLAVQDNSKTVVVPQQQQHQDKQFFRRNPHVLTIKVEFPDGSSFDKDAYSFEDELSAVIRQVRLLERTAEDTLDDRFSKKP